ncbi:MAG: hypothetical protein EHM21_11760 [Chloroflexi bacterium]|nr:MAG: hypothetical protein EHM21_11760 [Chloroflexota bacterium]
MNRFAFSSTRVQAAFALSIVLALGAVAFLLTGCGPAIIPVTGQQQAVPAVQAGSNTNPGGIYLLETSGQGVSIADPGTAVEPGKRTYRIGAGYRLAVTSSGGMIIPPAGSSTENGRVDLGSGYGLEISDGYGRIIPPANRGSLRPLAHDPNVEEVYLGGDFWLVSGPEGRWILQDETP